MALILVYRLGWALSSKPHGPSLRALPPLSVVVPARNEASNLGACLQSLLSQDYPQGLLEIIVVDDHSDDATPQIAEAFSSSGVRLVKLADFLDGADYTLAFKKRALATGIAQSTGEVVVTTDADCVAGPSWLAEMGGAFAGGADFVIAPVDYQPVRTLLDIFQALDFAAMQGITAAAHRMNLGAMCNGANLGFRRAAFERVGGYRGTDHLASGDDYLLLRKFQEAGARIYFVKNRSAIVSTQPQPSMKAFIRQRIRWASKSGKYSDPRLTAILLFVYLYNLFLLSLSIAAIFSPATFGVLLICSAGLKIAAEIVMIFPVLKFFGKARLIAAFPFLQPLHVLYVVLAGAFGAAGTYRWKGRQVR